jgi:hypothetical protein
MTDGTPCGVPRFAPISHHFAVSVGRLETRWVTCIFGKVNVSSQESLERAIDFVSNGLDSLHISHFDRRENSITTEISMKGLWERKDANTTNKVVDPVLERSKQIIGGTGFC